VGKAKLPEPVKLFVSFISNQPALMEKVQKTLVKKFGPVDFESGIQDFTFTSYYNKELGNNLKRKILAFNKLLKVKEANRVKIFTNRLEVAVSVDGKRRINIDPGYIAAGKLILFSAKDYYHRVYIGKGIFAEATLQYKDKTYQSFEWSYPDYKSREYINCFNKIREDYLTQLRKSN